MDSARDYKDAPEGLFREIKFFVSGEISDLVLHLLKTGSAERLNYFSDYITHLICGVNPEENDVSDANDLYEVPAITPNWIVLCAQLGRLVNTKPFIYNVKKLFSNLVICFSKAGSDRDPLWALITYNGGTVQLNFDSNCTHLVTIDITGPKYEKAEALGIAIVTPDWIVESIRNDQLIGVDLYHPRLIQWPKIIKHESTTAITGFEPEKTDSGDTSVADSTQALLEKLKQRMPWNQPQVSSTVDVAPPNVVAPSFVNKQPNVRSNVSQIITQQQVSRNIVHHPSLPQPQSVQQNLLQQQQLMHQQHIQQTAAQQQQSSQQQIHQQSSQPQIQQLPQQQIHQQSPQQQIHQQSPQQQIQQQSPQGQMQQPSPQGQMQQQSPQQQMQQQPPQQQIQQQAFNNPNQLQLNRLIGASQNRSGTLQQLRGQLTPNQFHQQLMQHRLVQQQQQNQQNPQRPLGLTQQQLLQQQLAQRQVRHLAQQQILQQGVQQPKIGLPPISQQGQQIQQQNVINVNQQQQQQFGNIVPGVQNQQMLLQQQQKVFVPQQQPQQAVQTIQQQQFLGQQQFNSQQPNQQFVSPPQPEQGVTQNAQFPQQLLLTQQQQQPQFNQQQQRPQLNQHLWQQQQQQQPQMAVRHPVNIVQQGPRIQWTNQPQQQQQQGPIQQPQRQFIQLDAQTHNQLQKMSPEQQAAFVQKLQKQKHQHILMQKQLQQRAGGGHILIRGSVPPGLSPQQQMQWLQRQAKQQGVLLPPNIQQQTISSPVPQPSVPTPNVQHTPGLSPIQQQFPDQNQQQMQLKQYRLQQLQREQAQKAQLPQNQPMQSMTPATVRPPIGLGPVPDSTTNPPEPTSPQLVVNAKTKTALANMLSIRLQSGGTNVGPVPDAIPEQSAAGTLRLMTAQHNAALNPNNRPQDLLALQQRRVINGPNGEIIRPPIPQPVPQTEAPKIPFSPRPTIPTQHRPGPYYGHNPNLKLPPDLFLLGCIFVVVEIERYLDESLPGWQQKIEKHGGEIEKQYCNRVTHVLCETQRHGVVMQALRDCKRCITLYWLSDVMKRKQVLPPWTALHLPTIYLDTTPIIKHLITLSGFTGCDRTRVKRMISYTGAKFTSYFSKHNTLLVAAKNEGPKYTHAMKWGVPVVNIQWLTDIMLGNFTALNQIENQMYKQFQSPPNFGFDPKLVQNLMHAWKMPINISQESYERVKRSASPVLLPKKAKRIKTETDENDNVNALDPNCSYRILFSMCANVGDLQKIVKQLGGGVTSSYQNCTHLVMPSLARTNKLLFSLCRDVYIVPEQWLRDSQLAQKFLDENSYALDTKEFNSEYKCDFKQTLNTKNRNRLFDGKFFWITPSVYPSKSILTELIQNCGGFVEKLRRTSAQIDATNLNSPYSYIIITHENDIHLVADLLRNKKDKIKIVCSAELIFSAILKQTFEVEPFAVKVL